jgi:DNA-directed RNA polymerase subunit M/transcription elongation factor TFIIS
MIRFACPGCSATFTVGEDQAGKAGQCPKCNSQFLIPTDATADEQPPPLPDQPPPLPSQETAPKPPPLPVEIQACPQCQTRLSVDPKDVGGEVACPGCATIFRAARADAPPPPKTGPSRRGKLERLGSGTVDPDDRDEDDRRGRRSRRRRDEDDDYDDRDRRTRRGGCPSCGCRQVVYKSEISTAGWITFAILLAMCGPLCLIGLFMKEEYRACADCGRKFA